MNIIKYFNNVSRDRVWKIPLLTFAVMYSIFILGFIAYISIKNKLQIDIVEVFGFVSIMSLTHGIFILVPFIIAAHYSQKMVKNGEPIEKIISYTIGMLLPVILITAFVLFSPIFIFTFRNTSTAGIALFFIYFLNYPGLAFGWSLGKEIYSKYYEGNDTKQNEEKNQDSDS